jgi:hypothetical protein
MVWTRAVVVIASIVAVIDTVRGLFAAPGDAIVIVAECVPAGRLLVLARTVRFAGAVELLRTTFNQPELDA